MTCQLFRSHAATCRHIAAFSVSIVVVKHALQQGAACCSIKSCCTCSICCSSVNTALGRVYTAIAANATGAIASLPMSVFTLNAANAAWCDCLWLAKHNWVHNCDWLKRINKNNSNISSSESIFAAACERNKWHVNCFARMLQHADWHISQQLLHSV